MKKQYDSDKYKDFKDLPDINEETLMDLFNKRHYYRHFDNPLADDIVVENGHVVKWEGVTPIVRRVYTNPHKVVSKFEERIRLKNLDASLSYFFINNNDAEEANFELQYLDPSKIEDRYLRKRVKAYLEICRKIIKGTIYEYEGTEKKISMRRVYAFILAEAFKRGESKIETMSKKDFLHYVKDEKGIKDVSPSTLYQSIRSTYKGESFLHKLHIMKIKYEKEYGYAMKKFIDFYPELNTEEK